MSGENYRSATKSHDPGWNDPPKLNYSPGAGPTQVTKLNLNKRVAFPLANQSLPGTGSPSQPIPTGPPGSLPPPPAATAPSGPPLAIGTPPKAAAATSHPGKDESTFPEAGEMQTFVQQTLDKSLATLELDGTAETALRKRLQMIHLSWSEGKLGQELERKLFRLAKALSEGNATEAGEIHRSIIVDHGSLCVQWAPALRQLVLAAAPKQPEDSADVEAIVKPI